MRNRNTLVLRLFIFAAVTVGLYAFGSGGDITVYPQACRKFSEIWKPEASLITSMKIRVVPSAQTVLFQSESKFPVGGMGNLNECSVWDRKNWSCNGYKMKDGVLEPKCGLTGEQPYCEIYPGRIEKFMVKSEDICKFAAREMERAPKVKDGTIPAWAFKRDK